MGPALQTTQGPPVHTHKEDRAAALARTWASLLPPGQSHTMLTLPWGRGSALRNRSFAHRNRPSCLLRELELDTQAQATSSVSKWRYNHAVGTPQQRETEGGRDRETVSTNAQRHRRVSRGSHVHPARRQRCGEPGEVDTRQRVAGADTEAEGGLSCCARDACHTGPPRSERHL